MVEAHHYEAPHLSSRIVTKRIMCLAATFKVDKEQSLNVSSQSVNSREFDKKCSHHSNDVQPTPPLLQKEGPDATNDGSKNCFQLF